LQKEHDQEDHDQEHEAVVEAAIEKEEGKRYKELYSKEVAKTGIFTGGQLQQQLEYYNKGESDDHRL
jgi:hypothetical protein